VTSGVLNGLQPSKYGTRLAWLHLRIQKMTRMGVDERSVKASPYLFQNLSLLCCQFSYSSTNWIEGFRFSELVVVG